MTSEFKVRIEPTGFPDAKYNDELDLTVTWNELIWAVITVGKWKTDVFSHGQYSAAEAIHRAACIYAYCEINPMRRLVMTPLFATIDPSEKAIVSYYLGMAMSKIYADRVLSVPWLMHISRYHAKDSIKYLGSGRPDLYGSDLAGNWSVVEAKGRSRVTKRLLDKMRDQKSMVATINGINPSFRVGTATRRASTAIELRVVDPEPRLDAERLQIDPVMWIAEYYAPLLQLSAAPSTGQDDSGTQFYALPGTSIEIGITAELSSVLSQVSERAFDLRAPLRAGRRKFEDETQRLSLTEQAADDYDRLLIADVLRSVGNGNLQGARSDGTIVKAPYIRG